MKAASDNAGNVIDELTAASTTRPARRRSPRNSRRSSAARRRSDGSTRNEDVMAQHAATARSSSASARSSTSSSRATRCPKIYDALKIEGIGPDARGAAAARRRRRAHHRAGLLRRPAPRHEGRRTPASRSRCRSGTATLGRIMDVLGNPIDERGPVDADGVAADPPPGAGVRRAVAVAGAAGNRHQGDRPDLPVRQGRQGRPVRRRRRRQDRQHDGADQQHREGSTRACRCSPASASARARATTSTTR